MEIVFLGTGTSTGVPMIACDCNVCSSDDVRDKRCRTSILVRNSDTQFVVDTGPDFRYQCLRAGILDLDAVLYTHAHVDHIIGFDDLRRFTFGDKRIRIFASDETLANLQKMFTYAFFPEQKVSTYIKPDPVVFCENFNVGNIAIEPIEVIHAKIKTHGFIFGKGRRVAYIPDCKGIYPKNFSRFRGIDVLIIDALHHRLHPTHFCFAETLELIKELRPKQSYLIHMSHEIKHAVEEAKLPKNVALAYDGLKISV